MILKENGALRRMERPAAPSRLPEKLPEKRSDAENSDERDCDVISYIRGILAEKMDGAAVVEASATGFLCRFPLWSFCRLWGRKRWFTPTFRSGKTP